MALSMVGNAATAAMHGSLVPIAYATSTSSSVTFSNIPQTYQDLMVVMNVRDSTSATTSGLFGGFNGNFGGNTNYSFTNFRGDGATVNTTLVTNQPYISADGQVYAATTNSNYYSPVIWHIFNYTNSSYNKVYASRSGTDQNGSGNTYMSVGLWRQTAAITSVLVAAANTFVSGSNFTLYGVRSVKQ